MASPTTLLQGGARMAAWVIALTALALSWRDYSGSARFPVPSVGSGRSPDGFRFGFHRRFALDGEESGERRGRAVIFREYTGSSLAQWAVLRCLPRFRAKRARLGCAVGDQTPSSRVAARA